MISAKQAKQLTSQAMQIVFEKDCHIAIMLEMMVDRTIKEAAKEGCDSVELKYQHTPAEVNATILLVDNLRAAGYYAKSFFNETCTVSKIVIGWSKA